MRDEAVACRSMRGKRPNHRRAAVKREISEAGDSWRGLTCGPIARTSAVGYDGHDVGTKGGCAEARGEPKCVRCGDPGVLKEALAFASAVKID